MADPTVARKAPYPTELQPGTYYWCACGDSSNQPFCDGSHQGTEFAPVPFVVEQAETKYLCGCKNTVDEPFCDGTHREL